ncbi:hypothetical protein QYM36_000733 [Artemia franciscana]|uniref:Peptidase S1 domain-containing protein n=1 Tax=Artemia franciscana TaxID=6661 RepID=A0AA88ID48_ARTSF|nr:hypothetical protein QYM36_000733 [Artemia franciscana]
MLILLQAMIFREMPKTPERNETKLRGGSVISNRHVLTAAQCITQEKDVRVKLEDYKIWIRKEKVSAERIALHKNYVKKTKITESESDDELMIELDSFESRNVSLSQTNAALDDLGLTPIKLHNLSSCSKGPYYKRKKTKKKTKEILIKKAEGFDKLVGLLKEKLMSVGRSQKVQILTLVPESWSQKKVATEFQVTEYMVKQARKLKGEKGIQAIPDPKKDAVNIEESYKDLIKMLVCNVENSECMLRHCDNCLSDDALIEYLTAKLSEDYDLEEEIIISQWVNTDRTEMVKQSISVESCISLLSKSVEYLIPHSFITKSQSKTFKKLKEDPPLNTAIAVMDFS